MTHRDFEMTEEERALEKKIRRENIEAIVGVILFVVGLAVLFILFLFATPDQMSAECDYWKHESEKTGVSR